ncbi:MAG: hypothetical protein EXR99_09755 [Gemmataceae bacterium]|nr:hypothetical protein [Gemmataceae bacterium]
MKYCHAAILFALCPAMASAQAVGKTTLGNPKIPFTVVTAVPIEVTRGKLSATLIDNQAYGKTHREGYNGLARLRLGNSPSPFVENYAGLNLEHVNNGVIYENRDLQFEPRKHPMEIRKINDSTFELYQKPLPNTGLESCTRFHFQDNGIIDVTFACVPRKDHFPYGYLNLFWASYIQKPEDMGIQFLGRKKGEKDESWIRAVTPKHGDLSTHRSASDRRDFKRAEPFPLTLVFNESGYEYTKPFYFGRYQDHALALMFHPSDLIRFTQSPSGGGQGNPAWDFQWFIDAPVKDRLYAFSFRVQWQPWTTPGAILKDYEAYLASRQ